MEQEEHQLGSPRGQQVGLAQELETFDHTLENQHNPFSYYDEDNRREGASSEDETPLPTNPPAKQPDPKSESPVKSEDSPSKESVEVPENISSRLPIPLLQSPKSAPKEQVIEASSPVHPLSMFKEQQFSLGLLDRAEPPKQRTVPATDRAYKKEMDSDMQELKDRFLGREMREMKKKDSRKEGSNMANKTFAGGVRRQKRENTAEFEEMRMLVKMGFEKKKTNYEMLKEWDRKRAELLGLHGRIIELLQNEVDVRIKSSLQNFEYYQTFFREKARQEEKYATSPVINTKYALLNNSLSKNVYINCSVILNSLCDENTTRCRRINDFVLLIRNNILRQLTETHLTASQRQLLKVREKISSLKSALNKCNSETQERANELGALFSEQANDITNTTEKDFYRTQLSFLRKALQQIETQRKLGEYCLEYYHTAVQEELKRSQVIREAMLTYSRGLKATYNLEPELECAEIQQMSKQEQIKLIEEFFSLDEMFDERTLELFRARTGLAPEEDIGIDEFSKYISSFNYFPFDSRILLLKEFQVQCQQGKGKQATTSPCQLVITVDHFLHLFITLQKGTRTKPDVTIKISSKLMELRAGKDEWLELVRKEERRASMMSYFWDSKIEKVYRLKFTKKDNREQFVDYIGKLMVDQF